jgi:uncharacterized membrane protein
MAIAPALAHPMWGHREKHERGNDLDAVLTRNIGALLEMRTQFHKDRSWQDRMADGITAFAGSLPFVGLHLLIVTGWILVNSRVFPHLPPFDPFPFSVLATSATVEAIFLATFVLITQNRMTRLADRRANLDLQINLLAEHEVTRLIGLVDAIAHRLGILDEDKPDVEHLKEELAPEQVMEKIERAEQELEKNSR